MLWSLEFCSSWNWNCGWFQLLLLLRRNPLSIPLDTPEMRLKDTPFGLREVNGIWEVQVRWSRKIGTYKVWRWSVYICIYNYIYSFSYIYIHTVHVYIYIEYMLHLFDILWNIIQNRWLKYNGWSIRSSWIRSFYKILSPWSRKLLPLQERDAIRMISLRILDALLLPPYINFYFVIIPCWYFAQDANVSVQILTHTMLIDITPHWF